MTFYEKLCSFGHLETAWKKINKSNPDSVGLAGETIENFKNNVDSRLKDIQNLLTAKKYKFSPTRGSRLPKGEGKFRPLQISEIQDRVVSKAIALLIEDK